MPGYTGNNVDAAEIPTLPIISGGRPLQKCACAAIKKQNIRSITQAPPPAKRQNQKRIRHRKSEEAAENAVEDAGGPL